MPMVNRGSWVQVVAIGQGLDGAVGAMPPSNTGAITVVDLVGMELGRPEPSRLTAELDMYWSAQFKPLPLTPAEVDSVAVRTDTLTVLPPRRS